MCHSLHKQYPQLRAKICLHICPQTLSVLRSKNCELCRIGNVQGQISVHIFTLNLKAIYCVYYPSNILYNTCSFENWGISRGARTPLYGLCKYVQPQRVWFFSRFGHKYRIDFGHFGSQIGYGFCTLVLNWVSFLEETIFLILSVRPSTKNPFIKYVYRICASHNGHK